MSVMFAPLHDVGMENRNGKLRGISERVSRQYQTLSAEGVILTQS